MQAFCTVVAALLHYIYLVVFALMLAEGVEIFYKVVFVFAGKRSRAPILVTVSWGMRNG